MIFIIKIRKFHDRRILIINSYTVSELNDPMEPFLQTWLNFNPTMDR